MKQPFPVDRTRGLRSDGRAGRATFPSFSLRGGSAPYADPGWPEAETCRGKAFGAKPGGQEERGAEPCRGAISRTEPCRGVINRAEPRRADPIARCRSARCRSVRSRSARCRGAARRRGALTHGGAGAAL